MTTYIVEYCPIYKGLVGNLIKERQAPLKDSLFYFCKKAGYDIVFDDKLLSKEVEAQLTVILANDENIYSYDNIPTISTDTEFKEIQTRIFKADNAPTDCVILDKYF